MPKLTRRALATDLHIEQMDSTLRLHTQRAYRTETARTNRDRGLRQDEGPKRDGPRQVPKQLERMYSDQQVVRPPDRRITKHGPPARTTEDQEHYEHRRCRRRPERSEPHPEGEPSSLPSECGQDRASETMPDQGDKPGSSVPQERDE